MATYINKDKWMTWFKRKQLRLHNAQMSRKQFNSSFLYFENKPGCWKTTLIHLSYSGRYNPNVEVCLAVYFNSESEIIFKKPLVAKSKSKSKAIKDNPKTSLKASSSKKKKKKVLGIGPSQSQVVKYGVIFNYQRMNQSQVQLQVLCN